MKQEERRNTNTVTHITPRQITSPGNQPRMCEEENDKKCENFLFSLFFPLLNPLFFRERVGGRWAERRAGRYQVSSRHALPGSVVFLAAFDAPHLLVVLLSTELGRGKRRRAFGRFEESFVEVCIPPPIGLPPLSPPFPHPPAHLRRENPDFSSHSTKANSNTNIYARTCHKSSKNFRRYCSRVEKNTETTHHYYLSAPNCLSSNNQPVSYAAIMVTTTNKISVADTAFATTPLRTNTHTSVYIYHVSHHPEEYPSP